MDNNDPEKDSRDPEHGGGEPWSLTPSGSLGRSSRRHSGHMSRSARDLIANGSIGHAQSYGLFGTGANPLDAAAQSNHDDDEADLRWAALEKLPTFKRIRTSMLQKESGSMREVDVKHLSMADFHHLLKTLHRPVDNDEEHLMAKVRQRLDLVGVELPTIEVRYENLTVKANCYVGSRGLPTLWNSFLNILESFANFVHLSPTKKQVLTILENVNGVIKPGRMTLLLGPPGAGKTTLLLALSSKLDSSLKVKGKVTFNGHTANEFVAPKTAAYISQHDLHVGELTVRETMKFSSQVQGVGPQYEMLEEVSRREKESGIRPDRDVDTYMKATAMPGSKGSLAVEYILKTLGLDICADTVVGDEMRRGISGGQKKRVTTGEMLVGPLKALFMDEISTGLDSSTTFSIVRSLRRFTHEMSATTLISLLQPAPEVFNLFDDVLLLSEGQVVYHGPVKQVVEFFEHCGFKCPERKGIADFLQEVTSRKDQEQYWTDKRKPYRYVPVKFFAEEFQHFHVGARIHDELAVPYPKERCHPAALAKEKYSISNKDLLRAAFDRELTLFKRNGIVAIIKAIQITLGAFISMTTFFRTRLHTNTVADGGLYFNALFYAVITFMFTGFGELASTIGRLPVLIKQRDMLFIPAWAYSISVMVLSIPVSLLEVGIFTCMTYFVTGYAPTAGAFFKFFLILFLIQQQAGGMFRCIGAVCRTMTLGFTLGWIILLLLFMLGGFIIPRPELPVWWRWGYWVSNMSYAVLGISVNEFTNSRWDKPYSGPGGVNTVGARILQSRGQYTESYYYWISVGTLLGFYIIFNIGFTLGIQYMPAVGRPQAIMSQEELDEKEANRTGADLVITKSKSSRSQSRSLAAIMSSRGEAPRLSRSHRSSTSHRPSDSDVEEVAVEVKRGMILPFEPLSISFDDVSYFVDMPAEMKSADVKESKLQLLNKITGAFRPGVLTALVGVSGAGKSTLMDVLSGRKTGGYIEGDIRISGFPKVQKTFARISGYCEQNDIHSPQVTVRESLIYSAWLRLADDIDDEQKMAFVEEVLDLVELKPLENALVGLPGITGLSTEQRKRLTIAVELVANPSIIFMDEPTSGLDARAAAIVMRCVRNTVDTGRTVVCTIHQPSIDIFEAFDELLLLKRGGQTIYAGALGHNSKHLVEYFESVPGVPKIPEEYNPATWMLEVTNQDMELELNMDFGVHYAQSDLYRRNKQLVKELSVPPPGAKDLSFPTDYPLTFLQQLRTICWKMNLTFWRSPDYNLVRFAFTFFTGIICGSIFWQVGTKTSLSTDLVITLGALYGATLFICFNNASTVQTMVSVERSVYYREKAAGLYSSIPYALSQVLVEVPYVYVQATLYCLITYSMLGFQWTAAKFFWYYYITVISLLQFTYYGMMMVAITPNVILASIVSAFFSTLFNLYAGFLIPRPSIPGWWIWYYWACPLAWTVYGLIASQFGDLTNPLTIVGDESAAPINVRDYLKQTFGFDHSFLPVVGPMIFVWMLLFAAIFVYAIKFLNFQRR